MLPTKTRPFKRISLLLNKRSAANLEQLLLDVTEAFQIPRWHNDHVRRLYTLRGKIIKSLGELFRAPDPVFIAMGRDEITNSIITHTVEELHPNSPPRQRLENSDGMAWTAKTPFQPPMRFSRQPRHDIPKITHSNKSPPRRIQDRNRASLMVGRSMNSATGKQILPDKRMIKKTKKQSDEIFEIRHNANAEYEAKIRDLEKKSVEALKRLEAHMRSRELELKDKQEAELTQMKKSLMDVMKEKESGIWKKRKEIDTQEKRLQERDMKCQVTSMLVTYAGVCVGDKILH